MIEPTQGLRADPEKVVIISDTHFGDGDDLMTKALEVDRWLETITERGAPDKIVLLGDIFDLWKSTLSDSLRAAKYFFEQLSLLPDLQEIVLVPGNHDHDIFMRSYRRKLEEKVKGGDISPASFEPLITYRRSFLSGILHPESKVPLTIEYPFHLVRLKGKEILMSHGHHLDFFASSFGCFKSFWLSRRILRRRQQRPTLKEIELANLPFCGVLSLTPLVPEIVTSEYRFYRIIRLFSALMRKPARRKSRLRDALIKDQYDEISQLITLFKHPQPYCFIFGHTHRTGMGKLPEKGVIVVNSGSWVEQESKDVPVRTWVEIERDIKLLAITGEGPEILYSEAL